MNEWPVGDKKSVVGKNQGDAPDPEFWARGLRGRWTPGVGRAAAGLRAQQEETPTTRARSSLASPCCFKTPGRGQSPAAVPAVGAELPVGFRVLGAGKARTANPRLPALSLPAGCGAEPRGSPQRRSVRGVAAPGAPSPRFRHPPPSPGSAPGPGPPGRGRVGPGRGEAFIERQGGAGERPPACGTPGGERLPAPPRVPRRVPEVPARGPHRPPRSALRSWRCAQGAPGGNPRGAWRALGRGPRGSAPR